MHPCPRHPLVGQQRADAQPPRVEVADITIVASRRVVQYMCVSFQVADKRVDIKERLAVALAALQRAVHIYLVHLLHHVGQGQIHIVGQAHGG